MNWLLSNQSSRTYVLPLFLLAGTFLLATNASAQEQTSPPHPAVAPALEKIEKVIKDGPFKSKWSSLEAYKIPQWYRDAKFGVFIHWGPYAVPAYGSEWYPRMMYVDRDRRGENMFDHHAKTYGPQGKFGYKDFIPMFKAENFDAEKWVKLFKETGFKYVVPVAEHHDGFPMYDCSFTKWDSTEMGPKRDVVAELSAACRKEGLKFGVSSHRAFNWMYFIRRPNFDTADPKFESLYGRAHPQLFAKDADDYRKNFTPQDEQFKNDWLARTCELVEKYDPDLVWFDFGIAPGRTGVPHDKNHFAEHLQKFAAYYYNATSGDDRDLGIINYKWTAFPESAAVLDKERSKMAEIRKPFWQTDTAISKSSWGYTKDPNYKSPDRLVDDLVDIVSKNGCLLLNVGPMADGTIPEGDIKVMQAIGGWLKINGESIYNTTHWTVYGEGPTGVSTGHVSESKDKPFTAKDIRFTTNGNSLYATVLDWPEGGKVTIKSLGDGSKLWSGEISDVKLLGSDEKVEMSRDRDGLHVTMPKSNALNFAYVLKIKIPADAKKASSEKKN
jgi:alpha-L-fucosidase